MNKEHGRSIEFMKMSGAGNDFVVLDNRNDMIVDPYSFARHVCDRRKGIGADGLLLLEASSKADFLMRYYNSDGSYGGMCGNGGRCISRYAFIKQIVDRPEIRFEALEHIYSASILNDGVKLKMKDPTDFQIGQMLTLPRTRILYHFVNSGSPHCVVFLDENNQLGSTLDEIDVYGIGREIRGHEHFSPEGTNVNFVEKKGISEFFVRTYERGVEAETLACGTGSVAVALISNHVKKSASPVTLHVRSGELLAVGFDRTSDGHYRDVSLSGSAHIVFSGVVKYEFSSQSILDIV
jgi:diaminopimelate epimerase